MLLERPSTCVLTINRFHATKRLESDLQVAMSQLCQAIALAIARGHHRERLKPGIVLADPTVTCERIKSLMSTSRSLAVRRAARNRIGGTRVGPNVVRSPTLSSMDVASTTPCDRSNNQPHEVLTFELTR